MAQHVKDERKKKATKKEINSEGEKGSEEEQWVEEGNKRARGFLSALISFAGFVVAMAFAARSAW